MNTIDSKYQALLEDILDNGVEKQDRTGTGTISVFGRQIRHKMSQGFPLLTTKKMAWKTMVTELLWFLRGDTNIKFLLDYDCHIWDGDAYKNYLTKGAKLNEELGGVPDYYSKEEFIKQIKTDETFAKKFGDLGPIYGKQWRQWQGWMDMNGNEKGSLWYDQILQLVHSLKTNPDSRRLMVSAWNVAELDQMVLPPCHYGFQVYTRELSHDERFEIYKKVCGRDLQPHISGINFKQFHFDEYSVPKRAISLMWNQRSVDTFLGLPFNIASYALLLEIIAKEVNMIPEDLIGNLGDVHLYKNHIEQAKEQIEREPYSLPTIQITERNWYQHEKVKEQLGPKTFRDIILSYRPDCFELIGYESHPKIKAPLSN
jgi:thymidylate synthase